MAKKSDGQILAERIMFLSGLVKESTEEDIKDRMSTKLDKNFRKKAAFNSGRGEEIELTHLDKDTLEDDDDLDPNAADFEDENLGDSTWSDDEDLSDVEPGPAGSLGANFEDDLGPGDEEAEYDMTGFEETPLEDLDEPNAADDWMTQNLQNAQAQANKFKFEGKKARTVKITEAQLRSVIKTLMK